MPRSAIAWGDRPRSTAVLALDCALTPRLRKLCILRNGLLAIRIQENYCTTRKVVYRLSPVERSFGLAFTTLTILAPLAQAAPSQQKVKAEGTAQPFEFVATDATAHPRGYSFARQVLAAQSP